MLPSDDTDIDSAEFMTVRVPVTDRALQGIVNVIPLQLLSYHMGVKLGKNIDSLSTNNTTRTNTRGIFTSTAMSNGIN